MQEREEISRMWNNQWIACTCCVPATVLGILHLFSHGVFTLTRWDTYVHPHFTKEKMEALIETLKYLVSGCMPGLALTNSLYDEFLPVFPRLWKRSRLGLRWSGDVLVIFCVPIHLHSPSLFTCSQPRRLTCVGCICWFSPSLQLPCGKRSEEGRQWSLGIGLKAGCDPHVKVTISVWKYSLHVLKPLSQLTTLGQGITLPRCTRSKHCTIPVGSLHRFTHFYK